MHVCLSVCGLWGGLLTAPQPFNHVSTSFGTITVAGLPYKSAHKFRHGHAVYGLQHAQTMADYKAVSMNLMHGDIKITDEIYAPILSDEVQQRINRLADYEPGPKESDVENLVRGMSNHDLSAVMRIIAERLAA